MNTEIRDRLMQSWQLETEIETLMRAREKTLSRCLSCESGERVDGSRTYPSTTTMQSSSRRVCPS